MDALTRHRMLALAGVPGLRPLVEARAVPEVDPDEDIQDDELDENLEDEESDEGEEPESELEDSEEEDDGDESDDDLEEDEDDEEVEFEGGPSPEAAARDRQLRLLGVELRAVVKSNPRPGRQVVSAEGMKQYGLPIGADILPGMRKLTALQQQAVEALRTSSPEAYGRYVAERRQGKTHTDAMKSAGVPAKKAAPAKAAKATPAKRTVSIANREWDLDELEAESGLAGKSPAELKAIADDANITLPQAAKSAPARRLFILQSAMLHSSRTSRHGQDPYSGVLRLRRIVDARPAGTGRGPVDLDDVAARVREAPDGDAAVRIVDGLTAAQLRGVAERLGLDVPERIRTSKSGLALFVGLNGRVATPAKATPREAAPAKKATPRARFNPSDTARRLREEATTESDAIRILAADQDLSVANLRRVAAEMGIDIPEGMKAKTSLQLHIAQSVARERGLPSTASLVAAGPPGGTTPPTPDVPEGFGLAPGPAADRQRRLDRARTVGEALSEVDELASNEASPKAFEARLRIQARRGGLTDAQVDELVAAASFGSTGRVSSQDRQQLWGVLDRIAAEHGLQRLPGRAGERVQFDPQEHQALGDRDLRGKIVEVVRPGYAIVDDDPPPWSDRAPGERLVIVRSVVHDTVGAPDEGITEGQFLRDLAAKRPTLPALRKLAADVDLDVPDDVSRSRRKFEQFLAQHREHPGLLDALAAMPTGAEGFDPEPIAAEIVTLDNEAAIIARLSGITSAAQMRRVATAINLPVPASLRTAVQIREYIAREIRRDRTRWSLRSAEARHRTLQLLGIAEERADINPKPGDNNLRNYWVYGKGRARWNTFTELRRHLLEHVGPQRADRIAAEWFHLRYGFWPGDDRNRVRQGKPPRGKRIGPG